MKRLVSGIIRGIEFKIKSEQEVVYKRPRNLNVDSFNKMVGQYTRYLINEGFAINKQCKITIVSTQKK